MRRTFLLALLFAGSWWVLSEGDASSWMIGAPTVAIALVLSHRRPVSGAAPTIRLLALPGFAWFFVSRSLIAGLDVARRTLAPGMPIAPAMRAVHTTLPDGLPRVLLVATLSLLPGSLGVSIEHDEITLHVLDARTDVMADVRRTEARIQRLFTHPASTQPAA
jgi:multicomponent Na+:H+ antiporter subunit E